MLKSYDAWKLSAPPEWDNEDEEEISSDEPDEESDRDEELTSSREEDRLRGPYN